MAEPEPPTSSGTVDAQEHARVLKNFVDLSDQFAAANEVLSALGRSPATPTRSSRPSWRAPDDCAGRRRPISTCWRTASSG